MLILLKL